MNLKYLFILSILITFSVVYSRAKVSLSQKLVGKAAPLFHGQAVFPDGTIGDFNLEDYIGQNIVIYFYPMDNSPGCTIQAKKFRDEIGRLQEQNIMVVGVSGDSINSHRKFQKALALPYPLVADVGQKISIAKQYKASRFLLGKRVTYVIGKDGIIFKVFDRVDIKNQVDDILHAFAAQA